MTAPASSGHEKTRMSAETVAQQERFKDLARTFTPGLYRYAWWLTRDHALSDDLVQETLFRAWRSFDTLRSEVAARAWLNAILHNEFVREIQKRKNFIPLDPEMHGMADETASVGGADTDWLDATRVLKALPTKYLEPLLLQVVMGHSTMEIAQILELSQSTVLVHLHRGRQKLRKLLEPRGQGEANSGAGIQSYRNEQHQLDEVWTAPHCGTIT